jgi:TetR/AcrR family transcriptional regulator of autoinduction and epiphytic fitness
MTIHESEMEEKDGRKARSHRTRAAVAEAMLDCLEDGLLRPSAKQVAERAGVSTRAVFRHFNNMEALLEEAAQVQIERVMGQLPPVATEGSLEQRIDALVLHSVRRNEIIAPVRRAALLSEPFSRVIRERHAWLRAVARRQVRAAFAPELNALPEEQRSDRIAALRALLSFSYWEELRRHARLSSDTASRVLRGAVQALLRP